MEEDIWTWVTDLATKIFLKTAEPNATAERVLINADTGVHPDLLNSRFGYVAVSRASHKATIFTSDSSKMGLRLEAQVTKTSAIEIAQKIPGGHGLGLM